MGTSLEHAYFAGAWVEWCVNIVPCYPGNKAHVLQTNKKKQQKKQTNPSHIDLHVPVQVFCHVNKPPPFLYCTRVCLYYNNNYYYYENPPLN